MCKEFKYAIFQDGAQTYDNDVWIDKIFLVRNYVDLRDKVFVNNMVMITMIKTFDALVDIIDFEDDEFHAGM